MAASSSLELTGAFEVDGGTAVRRATSAAACAATAAASAATADASATEEECLFCSLSVSTGLTSLIS
jgi:hypothetical protein